MACSKYILTNTGSTTTYFNYRRCDDAMWEYQVSLEPNQTKNIWLINGSYSTSYTTIVKTSSVFPPATESVNIQLIAGFFNGSIGAGFSATSNLPVAGNLEISFTCTLGTTTGDTISIYDSVIIPVNETYGFTQVFINGDYTELDGTAFFEDITYSTIGSSVNVSSTITGVTFDVTPTPSNTEGILTPTQTPTNTETPTPTPTNTGTPTQTPTNTETPTQTPTNSETPTQTPTQTQTQTMTPTKERYSFNVGVGINSNGACASGTTSTIYGENSLFDTNTQFYDDVRGSVMSDMSGFYSYGGQVVELTSGGFETGGFSLCSVLPTQTPTPTTSETPTQTPTQTPTPTPTFAFYEYTLGTGSTSNDACTNYGISPISVYAPPVQGPGPNLSETLYLDSGLTTPMVDGYLSDGTAWFLISGGTAGEITSVDPNGCI